MTLKKTKKTKKVKKQHGRNMGTHGTGARKNKRGAGNKGGRGLGGSGKRADHHKTLIIKKYGNKYFGRMGVTSARSAKDKTKKINLRDIQEKINTLGKKTAKGFEINLKEYKVLGNGKLKDKLIITADSFSQKAKKEIEKAGGEAIALKKLKKDFNKKEKPKQEAPVKKEKDSTKKQTKEKTKENKKE